MKKYFGSLCVISAPSGAGKSTLINTLMNQYYNFPYKTQLSISYTTRAKRPGEIHGRDYYFVSIRQFEYMVSRNMFFEYARVLNHYYGTKKNNIKTMLRSGIHVILNIDWQGAKQIRSKISNVYSIFIFPPSKLELRRRLCSRGKDTLETITYRMQEAVGEMSHFKEYDYLVINDNINVAIIHLRSIILSEQLRIIYQKAHNKTLIKHLLSKNS